MQYLIIIYMLMVMSWGQDQPIKVLEATRQEMVGGRDQTATKWYYTIRIRTFQSSRKLYFDKVWIGQRAEIPDVWDGQKSKEKLQFSKGDTLLLIFTVESPANDAGAIRETSDSKNIPQYEGDGLIEMRFKKKKSFYEIGTIKVLDPMILR